MDHRSLYLECPSQEVIPGRPVLVGCPLDLTSTFRSGSDAAPAAIRAASDSIETYSPLLDLDLSDRPFADLGDLPLDPRSLDASLASIEGVVSNIAKAGARPLCLGGEHTITLPIVTALDKIHHEFVILHLDAHTDLRTQYEGSAINHATVIRRLHEVVGPGRLIQMGIRSGTRGEFAWMREQGTLMSWAPGRENILLERIRERPVYLTVDLDVLDPACFPGTGNPEAGGWFYRDMERLFLVLDEVELIAADVVELNPGLDPSQVSAITASKVVRELLLLLS